MKKRKEYMRDIEKRFESLRNEVADYRPEKFEYLERRFYELYKVDKFRFRQFCKNDIKEGKCPVREWFKMNDYPVTIFEKKFLQFCMALTEDSARTFLILMRRYLFMCKNSKVFQEKCRRLNQYGGNSFLNWFEKYKFKPVFKSA